MSYMVSVTVQDSKLALKCKLCLNSSGFTYVFAYFALIYLFAAVLDLILVLQLHYTWKKIMD